MVSAQASSASGSAVTAAVRDRPNFPNKVPQAGTYVVVLADQPEAAYNGHLAGYPATRPAPGGTFENDADAARYRGYLEAKQDTVLARIGAGAPIYRYTTALNGFAADLSGRQVLKLRSMPDVVTVQRDQIRKLQTTDSPKFLGLSGRKGVWARTGGTDQAGKNMVVGVLDTGLWPENPSFAGDAQVPDVRGFDGICQQGERWERTICNSKVISARYFVDGIGESNLSEDEYVSPRDGNGHGSHTASTAAGNNGVRVKIEGQDFGKASGMAPAAHIAVYKVCWEAADPNFSGCYTSDTVEAINKALQDGVDVMNYSISGSREDFLDPVELAFLGAAAGGVFVAASAGNSGPTPATVAHPSPWLATVAASTHHLFQGSVKLGNGKEYVGAMLSDDAVGMHRIVLARDVRKPDAKPNGAALCRPNKLDPDKVENRIVVCDRGIIDRVAKSRTVDNAGGVGMVLVNTFPNSLNADLHSVPTVHLDEIDGAKVKDYVRNQGKDARAALDPSGRDNTKVPQIAGFSSRGPLLAGDGDVLKPDISAPGVDVVAAVAPPFNFGRRWEFYSGTSMSSPHIAGLGAFIKHERREWTPAMVKSAMMTTAYDLSGEHSPFVQGAGHVNPRKFLDPGLAYDAGFGQWLNFIQGERKASNVNQASIAIGELAGEESVVRKVTNVSDKTETYTASVRGMKSVAVDVKPATIKVAPDRIQKFKVNFRALDDAKFRKYDTGTLVWKGTRGHVVRSPLVVRPVALAAPDEVLVPANTTSGSKRISGKAGFTGLLDLDVVGLEGATPVQGTVAQGDFDYVESVRVRANTKVARFDLNAENDNDDLDLYIGVGTTLVAASASGEADEQVTLKTPDEGTYDVYVAGFADSDGGGSDFTHTGWAVPPADQGNLEVRPDPISVTIGERFSYRAIWENLSLDQRWFGYVKYVGRGERTYVTIN